MTGWKPCHRAISRDGIAIGGPNATGNTVFGCFIGNDGTTALGNGRDGIRLSLGASGNFIGGSTPQERNIISGNGRHGIFLVREPGAEADTQNNHISGNYIGADASGTVALPNDECGIRLPVARAAPISADWKRTTATSSPAIGRMASGYLIPRALLNTVQGNFIGVNPSGNAAIPNGAAGVRISGGASTNMIGGAESGAGNIISGNARDGIALQGRGTDLNLVCGNYIGLDASGQTPLSNALRGVDITFGAEQHHRRWPLRPAQRHLRQRGRRHSHSGDRSPPAMTLKAILLDRTSTETVSRAMRWAFSSGREPLQYDWWRRSGRWQHDHQQCKPGHRH